MKNLKHLLVLLGITLMMWITLSPAFQHPEMTQLFLGYWPLYLGVVLSLFLVLAFWRDM